MVYALNVEDIAVFTNEFGNEITTTITSADVKNNVDESQSVEGVTIAMAGPTSTHENTVTLTEAYMLYCQLSSLFAEGSQCNDQMIHKGLLTRPKE